MKTAWRERSWGQPLSRLTVSFVYSACCWGYLHHVPRRRYPLSRCRSRFCVPVPYLGCCRDLPRSLLPADLFQVPDLEDRFHLFRALESLLPLCNRQLFYNIPPEGKKHFANFRIGSRNFSFGNRIGNQGTERNFAG